MVSETDANSQRVVLITGCSAGGMGHAVARELYASGQYWVFASARSVGKMDDLPDAVGRVSLDVTSDASVNAAVAHVLAVAGRIDVLVNNAGVNAAVGPTAEVSLQNYMATYEVNVFGVIRVTQAVAKHMIDRAKAHTDRPGLIVNIGSTVGAQAMPWSAAYNSSKAAIHSFSDTLRLELAPFGIRVQVVAPGKIQSHFGDNGAASVSTAAPAESRFAHVWDLIRARAMYSQSPSPAPMPADQFARTLRHHMENHGGLFPHRGALSKARQAVRRIIDNGAYLFVGPMSAGVWLLMYLPWAWRDAILTRKMRLARIAPSNTLKRDEDKKRS